MTLTAPSPQDVRYGRALLYLRTLGLDQIWLGAVTFIELGHDVHPHSSHYATVIAQTRIHSKRLQVGIHSPLVSVSGSGMRFCFSLYVAVYKWTILVDAFRWPKNSVHLCEESPLNYN